MIATETRKLAINNNPLHFADKVSNHHFVLPSAAVIDEWIGVKPSVSSEVSKSYEVTGKAFSESFFETSYDEEDTDFMHEYAQSHKNGIILIMTDKMTVFEINYFMTHMRDKLKYVIYYCGDASQFRLCPSKGLTFIRTFSLKAALNEAYRTAKNGQAIILPKIDPNFDFCKYIDNLN